MDRQRSNAFMLKMVGDIGTAGAVALLFVGDRVGLFKAMAGAGALADHEVAERARVAPRYAQEWLAVMAGAGYVEHDPQTGRFTLPDEHALFLTDPASEYYLGGLFRGLPGLMAMAPRLADAFVSGDGISFAEFGAELPEALAAMNRPVYESRLVRTWLPTLPDVVARLEAGGRAIDVGCGIGVVPMALATAYPQAKVAGLDFDARSIEIARSEAAARGLADRIEFTAAPVEALACDPGWDFVTTFDVIHDLPDPLAALARIRAALAEDGTYLMVEPKVADDLQDNLGNPFARMLYAVSCMHCVPQALAQGGPGLGACWGEGRARKLAAAAGFGSFERLDVRSPVMAFYALRAG
jgi:SAM-dependent methyltransferase